MNKEQGKIKFKKLLIKTTLNGICLNINSFKIIMHKDFEITYAF